MTKEELKKLVNNLVITDVSIANDIMNDENLPKLTLEDLKLKGVINIIKDVDKILEDTPTKSEEVKSEVEVEGVKSEVEEVKSEVETPIVNDDIVVDDGEEVESEPVTKTTKSKKSTK